MSKMTVDLHGNEYWKNEAGQFHREDGPAYVGENGHQEWFINGERHREDGPSFIKEGTQQWNIHGKCHREDGPAIIWYDGDCWWYVNDRVITAEVYQWMDQMSIEPDYTKWTDKEKMWFKLRFCGSSISN